MSFQGDIPNFFYRLQLPESLTEYFVLSGVSASELTKDLGLPPPEGGREFVAIRVCCMGWSWAPYFAETCLEAAFDSIFGAEARKGRVVDRVVAPEHQEFG